MRLSDAEADLVARLRRQGASYREIATALGKRPSTVRWYGNFVLGLLTPAEYVAFRTRPQPQAPERRRPTFSDFLLGREDNRGWADFLEDEAEGGAP